MSVASISTERLRRRRAGAVTPPHNLEAEQSVLGAILLSDRALYALVIEEGLRPEDFYRERHGRSTRRCSRSTTKASRSTC